MDAAYCNATKEAKLGVVARNCRLQVCFSTMTKEGNIKSPLQAERKAILFGLQVAREMDYKSIIVETDCLIAVQEISKKQHSLCEWNSIIVDIVELFVDYESCFITHVSRLANALAHNIAKTDRGARDFRLWRYGLPL